MFSVKCEGLFSSENRKISVQQKIGFDNMGPVKHCGNSQLTILEGLPSDSLPKGTSESVSKESPPKMKQSISELKADHEPSLPVKHPKTREQAVSVVGSIYDLCEQKGESLDTILTEEEV